MPKRILLVEESDTIRKIAESLLRQNGFEVLSMTTGQKALEVLKFTSPDLILTATDMIFKGETTLFEKLHSDPKTARFPILLLANEDDTDLPLPPEAVITKPFDPREFMEKINLFSGNTKPTAKNPLATTEVEDEFLDAALGLDRIDVTDSEILDQTVSGKINKVKSSVEKMIGYDHHHEDTDMTSDSGKVESLMIREDDTDMNQAHKKSEQDQRKFTETGSLEILDDQFGMEQPKNITPQNNHSDHDYNWFLDELANENTGSKQKHQKEISDSQSLKFEDNSTFIDPITPVSSKKLPNETSSVDKFIDEFKKEVEKFGSDVPDSITLKEPQQKLSESGSVLQWTDSIEKITPQQIELFKKEFVRELADKIAINIVNKIDADKLLQLLKQEIIQKAKKQ